VAGNVWDVPPMPWTSILEQRGTVWRCVETKLLDDWGDQAQEAVRIRGRFQHQLPPRHLKPGWLTLSVAQAAVVLGAPVRELFTACAILARRR
jgi:hypothetical protein